MGSVRIRQARKSTDNTRMWIWIAIGGAVLLALLIGVICWIRCRDSGDEKLLKGESKTRRYSSKRERKRFNDYENEGPDEEFTSSDPPCPEGDWFDRTCGKFAPGVKFALGLGLACLVVNWGVAAYANYVDPEHNDSPGYLSQEEYDNLLAQREAEKQNRGFLSNLMPTWFPSLAPRVDPVDTAPTNEQSGTHNYDSNVPPTKDGENESSIPTILPPVPADNGSSGGLLSGLTDMFSSGTGIGSKTNSGAIRVSMKPADKQAVRDYANTLSYNEGALPPLKCGGETGSKWNGSSYTEYHNEWCGKNTATDVQECTKKENEICWNRAVDDRYTGTTGTSGSSGTTSTGGNTVSTGGTSSTGSWSDWSWGTDNNTSGGTQGNSTWTTTESMNGSEWGEPHVPNLPDGRMGCNIVKPDGSKKTCTEPERQKVMVKEGNNWADWNQKEANAGYNKLLPECNKPGVTCYEDEKTGILYSKGPTTYHEGPQFRTQTTSSWNADRNGWDNKTLCRKTTDSSKAAAFDKKDYGDFKNLTGWEECTDAEMNQPGWS